MTSLFIATPSYRGEVTNDYCLSFAETVCDFRSRGWRVDSEIRTSSTLLATERNILFEKFYQLQSEWMLCVDADMGWSPDALRYLIDLDLDAVALSYASKHTGGPVHEPQQYGDLIKIDYVGLGFLVLNRRAILRMREFYHPQLRYSQTNLGRFYKEGYAFCDTEVWQGRHWGEDWVFCRRLRAAGLDLWLDQTQRVRHLGRELNS